ncbi:MAG: hypothetical protein JW699_04535 [Chitinispirillaceae bacterium]|nr:hypothetical protein [Chitinispirillaceae bacterium]
MAKNRAQAARIQAEAGAELDNLDRLKAELRDITARQAEADNVILRATASVLADIYNGIERALKIILSELDGGLPAGEDWHRQLLTNARVSTRLRPPLISGKMYVALIPYLGFRHVVRNAYGFELDADRVNKLASGISPLLDDFRREIAAFFGKVHGLKLR